MRIFWRAPQRIARGAGSGFLVGVVDWKPLPGGGIGANNSAALLDSTGALSFIYDKIHLVPFSEYVPWRKWLIFAGGSTGLIGDFQHGSQYKVGRIAGRAVQRLHLLRGYFPERSPPLHAGRSGSCWSISRTTAGSAGRARRSSIWRWRACARWKIAAGCCATPTTESPFRWIPTGASSARLPANIRGELDAPYGFRTDLTPYARWGDWLPWLCVIAALVLLLLGARDAFARTHNVHELRNRTHMVIEDLQRRQDELQKRIELVRSYL